MPTTSSVPVDLVILMDTSVSMKDEAVALSAAASAAIDHAKGSCPSDLRVTWLGLEGVWKGTHFNNTVHKYLNKVAHVAPADLTSRKKGELKGGGAQEDGARNIEDVTLHFDWREGAARAIFYLTDEALDAGGDRVTPAQTAAADKAIATAKAGGVTLHTYFGTTSSRFKAGLHKEFARVANATGGQAFTDKDSIGGFTAVLEKIICASQVVKEPETQSAAPATPSAPATAAPAPAAGLTDGSLKMQTANGIVAGTNIRYTISDTGTARAIFPAGAYRQRNLYKWSNEFLEFLTKRRAANGLTVSFSEAIRISQIVLGVNSYYASANITLSVSGGTATIADFDLGDGLQALTGPTGAGSYNPATGKFGATGGDQSYMIGSASEKTITSFTLTADNPEGFTLFFGIINGSAITESSVVAGTPVTQEPATPAAPTAPAQGGATGEFKAIPTFFSTWRRQ